MIMLCVCVCVCVYLVVCVWVHGGCLHAQWGLRRLDNHVVHIVATGRSGPRLRTVVVGDVLFGPGNPERNKESIRMDTEEMKGRK